jgi:hypothetical protein
MSFSLRGLFAAVAISAVLVAGFAYASPFWSAIVFHMTLGVLAFATICGILSVRSRPFWISFAVVGWVSVGAQTKPAIGAENQPF